MSLRNLFILLLTCLSSLRLNAQKLNVQDLVTAWRTRGVTQTEKAEATYEDMNRHLNPAVATRKLDSLQDYLNRHNNSRIWIRSVLYEGAIERKMSKSASSEDIARIKRAIMLAGLENDQQLLSELYTLYADNYFNSKIQDRLFYILKAIEMQRHIGFRYFPHIYLRFLSISKALYLTRDYRQSIHYGRQCLTLLKSPATNISCYILQLDLIGASYRNLGMADSTAYYYKKIRQVLLTYPAPDSAFQKIWMGVSAGGIGQALVLQKNYTKAYPLLLQNLHSSIAFNQWSDAAMAANALAAIHTVEKHYDSALYYHKNAYRWSQPTSDLVGAIRAAEGIVAIYRQENRYDSAYLYLDRYHIYRDSLQTEMNDCRLATLKSQVDYDDMQNSLVTARATISRQHQIRNIILALMAMVGMIALFLYNRYRLKQTYRHQLLERKNKIAAMEVLQAKDQIAAFTDHIKEKDRMIQHLQQKLRAGENSEDYMEKRLKQYTLVTDEEWTRFKGEFVKAYPDFYGRLYKVLHKMTPSEERLTALMYLRLSNQQIANTLGISKESVARSKRRLNQRIPLPPDVSLENYLLMSGEAV